MLPPQAGLHVVADRNPSLFLKWPYCVTLMRENNVGAAWVHVPHPREPRPNLCQCGGCSAFSALTWSPPTLCGSRACHMTCVREGDGGAVPSLVRPGLCDLCLPRRCFLRPSYRAVCDSPFREPTLSGAFSLWARCLHPPGTSGSRPQTTLL